MKKNEPFKNISVNYSYSDINSVGVSYEIGTIGQKSSFIINAGYTFISFDNNGINHTGEGRSFDLGMRFYLSKNSIYDKLYIESLLWSYTRLKFSDANYSGVYEYISPFNPNIGYKFKLGKKFTIDPSVGCTWKIEIMSRGDVDNRSFNNFVGKAGIKVGYQF
ncbi:MAG: hypothetical protein ACI7YS_01505 [Flavobacterium sp.]